jgi:hypothetical protein
MPELYSSKRTAERATYTPIKADERRPEGRAWDKSSYVAALSLTSKEMRTIATALGERSDENRRHLATLQSVVDGQRTVPSAGIVLENAGRFRDIPSALLVDVGNALVELRKKAIADIGRLQTELPAAAPRATGSVSNTRGETAVPANHELDPTFAHPAFPGAQLYRYREPAGAARVAAPRTEQAGRAPARARRGTPARETRPLVVETMPRQSLMLVRRPPAAADAASAIAPVATASQLIDLARSRGYDTATMERAAQGMHTLGGTFSAGALVQVTEADLAGIEDMLYYFGISRQVEPVGFLHLERLNFIPAGIERGELMHSVPLAPAEEVNISHKEWANTSEEFQRIVTDFMEAYSEEGVAEKAELSQSTSSQHQHSSGFNMSVTASGGYGPVSVTTAFGYNVADSASNSQQISRQQSTEVTRKAGSRTRKEHKISFKVASASGTEDQAVRKIKNPFDDKATRLDFYQLVRKWQVDLYRYGVRLTYDLTIPEPGSDILSKIVEINTLRAALEEGFNSPTSKLPWAKFELKPDQIDRDNYMAFAAQYGASVDTPPVESIPIPKSFSGSWSEGEIEFPRIITFEVDIPDGFAVWSWATSGMSSHFAGEPWDATVRTNLDTWIGASGHLTLAVSVRNLAAYNLELTLTAVPKPGVFEDWQMRVWRTLRDAAQARYEMNRTLIKDRLAKLQEELGGQDPLSLRKIEREEVMKGVLRWLFGPSFSFVVPGLPEDIYGKYETVESKATWGRVLSHGEATKFLHHAIEWENMTYFLYPYFWSHTARWELKKYLDHPDFLHRAFLKSGAARVVLTVRPGFETDFVKFVETGGFHDITATHPYLSIAREIEAHAQTNYPGVRSANPLPNARPLLTPLQQLAWKQMEQIIALLEKFKTSKGRYPTTDEGLGALHTYGPMADVDPWDRPWEYQSPGKVTDFELWTYGADGEEGGDGEDADITSWAEASLIGRWYDYTPTSALDISFNETMPTA